MMKRFFPFTISIALASMAVTPVSGAESMAKFSGAGGTPIIEQLTGATLTTQVGSSAATYGSGKPVSKEISLSGITHVVVLVGAAVEIAAGRPAERGTLGIDDNLSGAIAFTTSGDTLTIAAVQSFVAKRPRIRLELQTLQELESRATDEIRVTGIAAKSFALRVGGTGTTSIGGKIASLSVENTGSAFVDCSKVSASSVALRSRGSGSTQLPPAATSSVRIDGSGSVFIPGDVSRVSREGSGSGTIVAIQPPG